MRRPPPRPTQSGANRSPKRVHRARRFARRLVVMVKAPVAGRVKTRLAQDIGTARATAFYRHTTAAVLARLARCLRWETTLAFTPDTIRAHPLWPRTAARAPQAGGDLGQRLQRIMEFMPPGPVVIIGTDVPAIRASDIAEAFRPLGRCDAVIAPAHDGGYWLVGLKRRPRVLRIFRHIRWSSAHALADTLHGLSGHAVAIGPTLGDVDEGAAFASVAGWCGRRVLPRSIGDQNWGRATERAGDS
jgi:rSAM/selenodomain-associated transferase 1